MRLALPLALPLARLAAALLLAACTPALAQKGPPRIDPAAVLSVVTADWNEDGLPDRAVLVADASEPDLVDLHLALSAGGEPLDERSHVPGLAWQGMMWGTQPELVLAPNGSLRVISRNDAIGRNRWERTLVLAFRDGRFVVAGLHHVAYDTLDPQAAVDCDVNLLTGRGIRNGAEIRTRLRAPPLADWRAQTTPEECRLDG